MGISSKWFKSLVGIRKQEKARNAEKQEKAQNAESCETVSYGIHQDFVSCNYVASTCSDRLSLE
jgi:hypothetical protein